MSAFSKPGFELVQLDQDETGNPIYGYVDQTHEASSAPPVTVSISLPMYTPQELIDRITALAQGLTVVEGVTDVEVFLVRTCRGCGCTDEEGCFGGCWWISETDDLCSSCAQPASAGSDSTLNADELDDQPVAVTRDLGGGAADVHA